MNTSMESQENDRVVWKKNKMDIIRKWSRARKKMAHEALNLKQIRICKSSISGLCATFPHKTKNQRHREREREAREKQLTAYTTFFQGKLN